MLDSVERAIKAMHTRYMESLTLQDLASEALFSPFHFARMFRRVTGVTPGHYLTAVRFFEAKRLLLTTSLNVSDVVSSVGYSSVGTFTTRFTRAVGMSPKQYRSAEVRGLLAAVGPTFRCLPRVDVARAARDRRPALRTTAGSVAGAVEIPPGAASADVLVGVFDTMIPQRGPVACQVLTDVRSVSFTINRVPTGRWVVIAMAQPTGGHATPETMLIGFSRSIIVGPDRSTRVDLRLHEPRPTDPPIAMTIAPPSVLRVSDADGEDERDQRGA